MAVQVPPRQMNRSPASPAAPRERLRVVAEPPAGFRRFAREVDSAGRR